MEVLNERGEMVRLGKPLTQSGGEGTVFEVLNDVSTLAKIYHAHRMPDAKKSAKLRHLRDQTGSAKPDLLKLGAWPKSVLVDRNDRQSVVGFLMPRMEGKEIHQLYNPRDRQSEFASASWDFLIHVARNCAVSFETLHENGIVMADVNEKNLLVKHNGKVGLLDCDSYQIANGSEIFSCDVGVPLWTPPELQGKNYSGLLRTPNHDRFGLAVLIFELLFMGRHPYAGVPSGGKQYEIEEAIRYHLFAFSPQTWPRGQTQPPHTLPLRVVPERIGRLFERAFLPGCERPDARPTGREWAHELAVLNAAIKKACLVPGHKFWNGLTACPWCEIKAGGGPNFFISVAIHTGASGIAADVAVYWGTIQRVVTGALMQERVATPKVAGVKAIPMPFVKPQPSRLSAPQPPIRPAPLPPPALQPPALPEMPVMPPPTPLPAVPMGSSERVARVSLLGAIFFAMAAWLCVNLNALPLASGAGWGGLVCLFISLMKWTAASNERKQRKLADHEARESERRRVEAEHALRTTEYEATVGELLEQHASWMAKAVAGYQRACQRLESDYQSRLSAYSAQSNLYESERARFEKEAEQWNAESKVRLERMERTRRELDDACGQLRAVLQPFQAAVNAAMPTLEAAHQRIEKSKADQDADMRILQTKKQEAQLRQFLDTKLIRKSKIPGIGRAKEATLLAYGVESALDINPSISVPGIGEVLLGNLRIWRAACEGEFRYNANTPLPPAEVQAVKLRYAQTRQSALIEVRGGAGSLSALEAETRAAVSSLKLKILELARAHAQAVADHKECI